jgi:hypothetical protein
MDNILNNTLTGTTPLPPTPEALKVPEIAGTEKTLNQDITTLQAAQKSPNQLVDFQKAMAMSSRLAYQDRQKTEMGIESTAFDPTKVSGGTFSAIISNLEANRGADVGKIYATTMNAYASAQEQITNRLQFLQQIKQAKDQFDAELKLKKKDLKARLSSDKKAYKLELKKINQAQSNWEREFAMARWKAENTIKNQSSAQGEWYE